MFCLSIKGGLLVLPPSRTTTAATFDKNNTSHRCQTIGAFFQDYISNSCYQNFLLLATSLTDLGVRHWFSPEFSYPFVGKLQTFVNKLACQVSTLSDFLCCHWYNPCSRFLVQSIPGVIQRNYDRPCCYLFVEIIWYLQHLSLMDLGVRHWFLLKFSFPFVAELQNFCLQIGVQSFYPKLVSLLPQWQTLFKFPCQVHPRSLPKKLQHTQLLPLCWY